MKKKLITIVMGMVFWAGLFGGCGQTEVKQDNAITNSSEEGKEEGTAEEKELTGTIDEIKDFMFVVTDENDTPYSFTFEEKPEGLENVSNGDTVSSNGIPVHAAVCLYRSITESGAAGCNIYGRKKHHCRDL